jgi:seryl-tRNA synthetase
MLDIKFIREHPDIVRENIKKKGLEDRLSILDSLLKIDVQWRAEKKLLDDTRKERNAISEGINAAKKAKDEAKAAELLAQAKAIPEKVKKIEETALTLETEMNILLLKIPNLIAPEVPKGKDASENVEIKKKGIIRSFDFPVKNHVELLEALNLINWNASARVAGSGFYYLKGDLALLNQALLRFTIEKMAEKGYIYIEPPLMLTEQAIFASMDKAAIEQSVYSIQGENLHLIGTAEQSLLALHAEDAIPESELPKKYYSYTMCFRKEVGAHGINEKGLWRTHQFNKVEQFVFCKPEDSIELYDELMQNSEDILDALELPYRIIELCTGDLSDWKYRSADFEVWRPTTESYGEIMSLSNCTDYQARKLDIKCVDKHGNRRVLHTLNNTAMATSRIMVAIIENYQNPDGSITIPKVLQKYMSGKKVIT